MPATVQTTQLCTSCREMLRPLQAAAAVVVAACTDMPSEAPHCGTASQPDGQAVMLHTADVAHGMLSAWLLGSLDVLNSGPSDRQH